MAWVTPLTQTTGDLITASIWNQNVVDNPKYLKGQAGTIELEASLTSDTDITDDLGSITKRWNILNVLKTLAFGLGSGWRRETRITWEVRDQNASSQPDVQVNYVELVGGTIREGGSGQIVLKIDADGAGSSASVFQLDAQNSALAITWLPSKRAYFRVEMSADALAADPIVTIGFVEVPDSAHAATEHQAHFQYDGVSFWAARSSDGAVEQSTNVDAFMADAVRHTLEVFIHDSKVEFAIDGTVRATHSTRVPTNALKWTIELESDGTGGAGIDTRLTIGEIVVQADP